MGDVDQVCGRLETHIKQRPDVRGEGKKTVDVDDTCAFLAVFQSGALGTFHAGMGRSFQRFEISGSEGTLIYEMPISALPIGRLFGCKGEGDPESIAIPQRMLVGLNSSDQGHASIWHFHLSGSPASFQGGCCGRTGEDAKLLRWNGSPTRHRRRRGISRSGGMGNGKIPGSANRAGQWKTPFATTRFKKATSYRLWRAAATGPVAMPENNQIVSNITLRF